MNDHAHPDYCWIHHVVEKQGQIRCGECMHWFTDEAELVRDYNEEMDALRRSPDQPYIPRGIEAIFFCPHCAHDF